MEANLPRGRGALILAHDRQELLNQTIEAIRPQADTVMVIDNASDPPLKIPEGVGSMFIPDQPPVLSRFWNMGLDWFVRWYDSQGRGLNYDVAVLCDDAPPPSGWFAAVTEAMRETGAVAGSSSPWSQPRVMKYEMDSDIRNRMCSWAFIMDGASGVRADESMHWWYFDTSMDIDLRRTGGTVLIGTHPVQNIQPNFFTVTKPNLNEQAGRDGARFAELYGRLPW